MKVWLSVLLPTLLFGQLAPMLEDEFPVVTQDMVDYINEKGHWAASLNWAGNLTIAQARSMLGDLPSDLHFPEAKLGALAQAIAIPTHFDSRSYWPTCVGPIRDQGKCGSCWAFAATEVLADRYCISQGINVVLSPQWLVSCDTTNHGCSGGSPYNTWRYLASTGVPADACAPYVSGKKGAAGACKYQTCNEFYRSTGVYSFLNPTAIQAEVLRNGPVMASMRVYADIFAGIGCGVYRHTTGNMLGGHAVKIIGWGEEAGTSYWVVANSWGTEFGCDGYFKIAFGQCGLDSSAVAGEAALSYKTL